MPQKKSNSCEFTSHYSLKKRKKNLIQFQKDFSVMTRFWVVTMFRWYVPYWIEWFLIERLGWFVNCGFFSRFKNLDQNSFKGQFCNDGKKHSLPQKEIFFYLIKKNYQRTQKGRNKNFHVMTSWNYRKTFQYHLVRQIQEKMKKNVEEKKCKAQKRLLKKKSQQTSLTIKIEKMQLILCLLDKLQSHKIY